MGGKSSLGAACDVRRVPGPEGQTSLDRIDTAWELIKRAQHSLDDARSGSVNRTGGENVPMLLESIAASLLAIAKRM